MFKIGGVSYHFQCAGDCSRNCRALHPGHVPGLVRIIAFNFDLQLHNTQEANP